MSDRTPPPRSLPVGALDGVRVLGVEHFIAGPFCTQILADQGADVIKVEPPGAGDQRNYYFHAFNRNKRSIEVNLKSSEGKEVLYALVRSADVLVTNFAGDVPAKLGYDYANLREINPRLVYTHVTGFGHDGPYSDRPAFDGVIQAMAGIVHLTGERDGTPMLPGFFIPDHLTGLYAALATTLALHRRERSGEGAFVDMAMLDAMLSFNASHYLEVMLQGESPMRDGSRVRGSYASTYAAADGYVYLCPLTAPMWQGVATVIGHPELVAAFPRGGRDTRMEHRAEFDALITEWTSSHLVAEIVEQMQSAGVAATSIYSIEQILADPHVAQRGMVEQVPAALDGEGDVPVPASPIPVVEHTYSVPPPLPGQHTEELLVELGFPSGYLSAGRA